MSTKRSGCLWVLVGLILAVSLFLNLVLAGRFALQSAKGSSSRSGFSSVKRPPALQEVLVEEGKGEGQIALIHLRGLISSSIAGRIGDTMVDDIKIQLQQAVEDNSIKAIVLAIDSPGGEVTASDIIYNAVVAAREKKPVVISMGSLAASGGYYVACGGNWIVAHETTFTGSIGVIIQGFQYSDLLKKIGVEANTFKSGAFKDMLSGTREMTPEEKAYVQKLVMETYSKFVGIVAKERSLSEEELRSGVADGRIISGKDAFSEKLVNELGGIEAAYAKARELANAPGAEVITYQEPVQFGRLLRFLGSESAFRGKSVEVNLNTSPLPALEAGKAYYLYRLAVP